MSNSSQPSLPTVAIVGRPNVGKSALFNCIIGRRVAIVHEESGVTRDRISAAAEHYGRHFMLMDTGGLGIFADDHRERGFDAVIRDQLVIAIASADSIIFVVDVMAGVNPLDIEVARLLRESDKPVTVAANKSDNATLADTIYAFSELGFDAIIPTSCTQNINIHDLLDHAVDGFPEQTTDDDEHDADILNLAVVGRPNVGKSTTVNRLLGHERVIVSDVPGTTRDAVDIQFSVDCDGTDLRVNLIDTAGLKRQRNLKTAVEFYSSTRAESAVRRADLVLLLLDATTGVTSQDKRICRIALDNGKACILIANKWDLAGVRVKQKALVREIRQALPFIPYAPLLVCCAQSGYNFSEIFPHVMTLHRQMQQTVPTPLLNQVLHDIQARTPPPGTGSGSFKIYYGVYRSNRPPTFLLFVNKKRNARKHYLSFLQAQLRQAFNLNGLPIEIRLAERRRSEKNE